MYGSLNLMSLIVFRFLNMEFLRWLGDRWLFSLGWLFRVVVGIVLLFLCFFRGDFGLVRFFSGGIKVFFDMFMVRVFGDAGLG